MAQDDTQETASSSANPEPDNPVIGCLVVLFLLSLLLLGFMRVDPVWKEWKQDNRLEGYPRIPILAESISSGIELLGPGKFLSVARYSGGTGGTPIAPEWTVYGRVAAVWGDADAKQGLLLALEPTNAHTLQAALAIKDGNPLSVAIITEIPTYTPMPTGTPEPSATPIPPTARLEIPTALLYSETDNDQPSGQLLSLIIVPKLKLAESPPSYSPPGVFHQCVALDPQQDADNVKVVLLDIARLTEAAAALTYAERVYLVPGACPTPVPATAPNEPPAETPTAAPTSTPGS